ncbi:MAG: hypothetical protein Alpg2KO_20380 [Alphaproteobacteria bacterium]
MRQTSRLSARLHGFFSAGRVEGWQLGATGQRNRPPGNRQQRNRPGNRLVRALIIGAILLQAALGYVAVDPNKQFEAEKDWLSRTVAEEYHGLTYDRKDWRHWVDEDKDCQNTRQEVLIAESVTPVKMDDKGCRVVSGTWIDPFTGQTFTNPRKLDIDHMVPLKEAHRSGGHSWTAEQRRAFANDMSDPRSLIAVSASANRSKGDRDPANWLPKNEAHLCKYVIDWQTVKARWQLTQDPAEAEAIDKVMTERGCKTNTRNATQASAGRSTGPV